MSRALLLTLPWDVSWKRREEGERVPDRNWELGGREVGFPAWLCLSWLLSPFEGSRSGAGLAALQTLTLTIQSRETSWQNRVCGEVGETGAEAVITRNPCRGWVTSETLPEFCLASTLNRSQVSSRMSTSYPLAPCSSCQAADWDTHNQTDYRVQRRWFERRKCPCLLTQAPVFSIAPQVSIQEDSTPASIIQSDLISNRPRLSWFLWLCGFGQFISPHRASVSSAMEWGP